MRALFPVKRLLALCLWFSLLFIPVITSSAQVNDDELVTENFTITSTARTTVQLTSQLVNTRIDQIDREYESSLLKEILVPTNDEVDLVPTSSITVSKTALSPLSSKPSVSSTAFTEPASFISTASPSLDSIGSASTGYTSQSSIESHEITSESNIETSKPTESSDSISASNNIATEEPRSDSDTESSPTGTPLRNNSYENQQQSNESIESEDSAFTDEENAQFLSFEEWKKKKGVDPNAGQPKEPETYLNRVPKNPSAKDSIGEEMEIDISNFFDSSAPEPEGKIYKDKFNFASFDCAATIVKTNSEAKGATSILFENKDSYLLNPCSAPNKFVVIELCQDILVDSVAIGNFEFFSSTFKKIQISVSETFPVPQNGWKILGQFDAKDIRDFQTFEIDNPMIWAKYFRVEILDHYGSEFYCPLSVVRVHGKTMMQEYKQEEALQKSKVEEELESTETERQELEDSTSSVVAAAKESLVSEIARSVCPPTNDSSKVAHCILTDTQVNNSIRDIQKNLTNLTDNELNDECLVSLPHLKFDELFDDLKNEQSKCDTAEFEKKSTAPAAASTQSTATNTGTQESIYKNIMKRLSLLESNATLSVLYIEEQSKLLSTAFSSLEKKQSLKFDKLIDTFNTSIYNQLENLSTLYSLFQKQTDELLTNQRLKHEHLLHDANLKIDLLTSDLKFQKILSLINGLVLICVLVYVVITRDTFIEEGYVNDDKLWVNVSKRRISTGLKLKANLKRMYYNSDGGYDSPKSFGPSDEEVDDGRTTPSSNEKQEMNISNEANNNNITVGSVGAGSTKVENRPLTPENSDHE